MVTDEVLAILAWKVTERNKHLSLHFRYAIETASYHCTVMPDMKFSYQCNVILNMLSTKQHCIREECRKLNKSLCLRKGMQPAHFDIGCLGFPTFKHMLKWFPSSKVRLLQCFSCSPPRFKLIKIKPLCCKGQQIMLPNYASRHQLKSKLCSPSQATSDIFTFTLFLPEIRAGKAWEPPHLQ
jgi:hypothetical protein